MEKWKQKKIYPFLVKVLFPALLILYPLRHICFGVEWWDTGYNYGNFTYMGQMDPMWKFSTYLANAAGSLLTRLPFGDRMMGLNFYTGLFVSILALAGYLFFTKRVKIPPVIAFLGEVIAIGLCWCPTALLYNYLTYLLLFAGVYCLYRALTEEKNIWFVLAGICLGINVFVRFSNLAQMALIVGVWAYAVIRRKKFKTAAAWTGWCLLGYAAGLGGFFAYICIRYGAGEYISAVQRLFAMTEEATDYTMTSMVLYQFRNYLQNVIWMAKMLPFVLLGILGFALLPEKFLKIKKVGYVCCMGLVFYRLMNQNMFNMKYSTKLSVFQWAVCLLTFTMVLGIYVIFSKKASEEEKLLCGFSILVAVITPLGSNNHLYSSMNNLFFGAPVILWILWKRLSALPAVKTFSLGGKPAALWISRKRPSGRRALKTFSWKGKKLYLYTYPVKAVIAMILAMLLIQSLGFGFGYVFSESDGGENLHTKIENSDILKGMYTDETRAGQLETLLAFVQENGLTGRQVILYGGIPALSYYLEMPFAISAWPDLASYNYEVMETDLYKIREAVRTGSKAPVLLLEISYGTYLAEGAEALAELVSDENKRMRIEQDKKFALLMEFAADFEYELRFANDKFLLFQAGQQP